MLRIVLITIAYSEVGVQILIVFVGGSAFQVTKISGRDWGISIALGFASIPIGVLIRCIPTPPCERALIKLHILSDPNKLPEVSPASEDTTETWNPAINRVRDNLTTFGKIRGGRVRGSSFVGKSRQQQLERAGITL